MVGLGWRLLDDAVGIVSQILGDVVFDGVEEELTLDELHVLVLVDVLGDGLDSLVNTEETLGPFATILRSDYKGDYRFGTALEFVLRRTRLYGIAEDTEWIGWVFGHGWFGFACGHRLLGVLEEVVPVQHVLVEAWLAVRVVLHGVAVDTLGDWEVLVRLMLFADGTALLSTDWLTWIQ